MSPIKVTRDNHLDITETTKFWFTAKSKQHLPVAVARINWFFETQAGFSNR